ncbi:MAG: hypothetical protein ACOVQA_14530 [Thermoflexibacteraceae bacterium]|jgi:gliding motility-associated lipoprotein GldH
MKNFFYVLLFSSLLACNQAVVEERFEVPNNIWLKEMPMVFNAQVEDTSSPVDVVLSLRHGTMIAFKNVNMKLSYTTPSGKKEEKYFTFDVRNADGSLKGEAAGDICDTEMTIIIGLQLMEKGKYVFSVQHEMEDNALPLIMDMTLLLKKPKK